MQCSTRFPMYRSASPRPGCGDVRDIVQVAPTGVGRGMLKLRRLGPLNDSCFLPRAFSLARGWREKAL
eukprot:s1708_g8.t1